MKRKTNAHSKNFSNKGTTKNEPHDNFDLANQFNNPAGAKKSQNYMDTPMTSIEKS